MSAEHIAWVWRHSPATGALFTVHLAIGDSANDMHDGEFWMGQSKLAVKARVSRKTANEALTWLIDQGLLELLEDNRRHGKPNRYKMLMPGLPAVFDSRAGGVTRGDTPYPSGVAGGVTTGDRGVTQGYTGVSPGVTQNSSINSKELPPPTPPTPVEARTAVAAATEGGGSGTGPKASASGRTSALSLARKIKARRRSLLNLTQLSQVTAELLAANWSETEILSAEPSVISLTSLQGWDIALGQLPRAAKVLVPRPPCSCSSGWILDETGEPASRCSTCLP